ncbi:hypothetical protein [Stenotrophomonas maltophilia]|uniref:Uncharacterized protein n=1 Tax=Stenotrophomonas maltophilia TaxID=40324 RepID=A0A4S2D178_STEMA|nr:hypothetical protein [Stenotrophomonas maltophilia]TGY35218.1 hypothetical protein E5352_05720 [Stenotrophomonas maltophilia]
MSRTSCSACCRWLPPESFQRAGKKGRDRTCIPCRNDQRRLRAPLPAIQPDPVQVRINNTFNLWHGPVSRVPLRSYA